MHEISCEFKLAEKFRLCIKSYSLSHFSGQGFVVPGNNKLGYLFYKERYYSTSTVDRAEQFGRNPDLFIVAIKKLIRDSPCLLKLLNVTDEEAEEEESPSKFTIG